MREYILIMLLIAMSNSAMAEWVKMGDLRDGDMTAYVNPSTIGKTDQWVTMWWLSDFITAKRYEDKQYLSEAIQVKCVCKEK